MWILVIGMVLNGIMNGPYYLQMATGWTDLLVRVNAVMVVIFVPTIYVLTLQFSMVGAAVAWVVLNVIYIATVARLMHRRLLRGEMREWYLKDLLAPLSTAAVTAFVLRALLPAQADALPALVSLSLALAGILLVSSLAAGYVRGELASRLRLVIAMTQ
jgi:O-antigen/teichoic acid export membrane protein